jgi:adenylate cyclase class IV
MKEVEDKILEVNRKMIDETLIGLGAKKIFDGDMETFFFDFKDCAITKAKNMLRLRKEQDKTELTYKKVHPNQTVKVAEEYSVEISSFENCWNNEPLHS